ncbi:MAG: TetR family transcriptional regulator [Streptosporangiales bacterium]|nr:TetR family transcriptional regulator [Streptosporangiales bacterium]
MPKVVEHDRRRAEIADAALALVARAGTRAATIRAVAEETGWSAGALNHYYASRQELLVGALRRAAELQGEIFQEIERRGASNAMDRLRGLIESVLPLDDRRLALTRVFLVFYAEATADPHTHAEVVEYLRNWRRVIRRAVGEAQREGAIPASLDATRLAAELVAVADGLAIHGMLDPSVLEPVAAGERMTLTFIEDSWLLSVAGTTFSS